MRESLNGCYPATKAACNAVYFHISTDALKSEDEKGMELPSVVAALSEADKIAEELRADIEALKLTNSVVQIVSASGQFSLTVPTIRLTAYCIEKCCTFFVPIAAHTGTHQLIGKRAS